MEADINNLGPAIGKINGDRYSHHFGMLTNSAKNMELAMLLVPSKG